MANHNLFGLPYDIPINQLPHGPRDTALSLQTQATIAGAAVGAAGYAGGKVLEGTISYAGQFIPTGNTRAGKRFRSQGQTQITEHFPTKKQKSSQSNLRGSKDMTTENTENTEAIPAGAAAAAGPTGIANTKGHETQVTPIPRHITFGLPGYTTARLMYRKWSTLDYGANTSDQEVTHDKRYKMNSIYDIDYAGAAPQWRDYFMARYDYYTVLGCEYKIRYRNQNASDWILLYRTYGEVVPSFDTHLNVIQLDPHMKSAELPFHSSVNVVAEISGYASHEDYKGNIQEIIQDGNDQIWTVKATAPSLIHDLRIMPRRRLAGVTNEKIELEVELVYTVQFKELNSTYRFNTVA